MEMAEVEIDIFLQVFGMLRSGTGGLVEAVDVVFSVPKRPVRPSLAYDGTDAKFETFGRDRRRVAVCPDLSPGRTAGPSRCLSLCFTFEFHEH